MGGGKQTAIVAGGMLLQQVSMFVTGVLIGRVLGAEDYGLFALLRNGTMWLLPLASLGLELAVQKYAGRSEHPGDFAGTLHRLRLVAGTVNGAVLGLLWAISLTDLSGSTLWVNLGLAALCLPFLADLLLVGGYWRARGQLTAFSLLTDYVQAAARLVLVAGAAVLGASLGVMLAINAGVAALSWLVVAGMQARMDRKIRARPAPARASSTLVRSILGESLWMALSVVTYGSLRVADLFVLGFFVAPHALGSYAALSAVATFVRLVPLALSQGLGPRLSRLHAHGELAAMGQMLRGTIAACVLSAAFVFGGIAAFGPFLDLIFGPSFSFDPVICVLLPFSWLVSSVLTPVGYVLSMTRHHRSETMILLGGVAIFALLLLVLVPAWGATGAALASTAGFLVVNMARLLVAQRMLGEWLLSVQLLQPVVAALALAYVPAQLVAHWGEPSLLTVGGACGIYATLYAGYCMMFQRSRLPLLSPA